MISISKVKTLIISVVGALFVVSCVAVFIYIKVLNQRIDKLNDTVTSQEKEIEGLYCQIKSLESNIESFRNTLNTTNNYINKIKEIQQSDAETKSLIYKEVISNEDTKEWYDRRLPDNIISIINGTHDGVCKD